MYVEEIALAATLDDGDVDPMPEEWEITASLVQTSRFRCSRVEFALFSNYRLSIKTHGALRAARDYSVDVGMLDALPRRSFRICMHLLLVSVILSASALFVYMKHPLPAGLTVSITLALAAVLSLVLTFYRSHDRLVFYSRNGRVPLVVMFSCLPGREDVAMFSATLAQYIEAAKAGYPDENHALRAELREHRRLMEEGIISARRYAIVKQRILGLLG